MSSPELKIIDNQVAKTRLLDAVNIPADMKPFTLTQLRQLADEVRQETINAVASTGGHLGASLGVVELTVAIHHVFNTPYDRLIWDVGHQAYPHKILTGRKDRIKTLRQGGGLSGFTKRSESEYDPFGAAHSSTSISAGLGMAMAAHHKGERRNVISVIGDGAISAGMAYEAMNNAGDLDARMIVILNDNDMSIAPPTGAMSKYLSRLVSGKTYRGARDIAKKALAHMPKPLREVAAHAEESARGALGHGTMFEDMGFYYIGPVDGHDLDAIVPILKNLRDEDKDFPVLLHVVTQKGKGYAPAEAAADKMHGVVKFDVVSGAQNKATPAAPAYTKVFAQSLIREAQRDERIIAVTAAMPTGTGLDLFAKEFPDRTYDVGIAEQHAVTFAAGLACEGLKPFATIYSTFLQRGYDQVVHDVAIQNLPVRFAMDRAGLVGADGCTHAGAFDIAYLGCLPNMVLMAPADENELSHMVATAAAYDNGPIAFRFPRGEGTGVAIETPKLLQIGKGRVVREGNNGIALLSYGTRLQECLNVDGITVADARFAKPIDTQLIDTLVKNHHTLITIEEGSRGGFGAYVAEYLTKQGHLDNGKLKFRMMTLPDVFQDHDKPEKQHAEAGLNTAGIQNLIDILRRS